MRRSTINSEGGEGEKILSRCFYADPNAAVNVYKVVNSIPFNCIGSLGVRLGNLCTALTPDQLRSSAGGKEGQRRRSRASCSAAAIE